MPSMRLKTQAAQDVGSEMEWQTVGSTKGAKPKPAQPSRKKSNNGSQAEGVNTPPAARQPERKEPDPPAARVPPSQAVSSASALEISSREIGADVLAAYDAAWAKAAGVSLGGGGKGRKEAAAPAPEGLDMAAGGASSTAAATADVPPSSQPSPDSSTLAAGSTAKSKKSKSKSKKKATAAKPDDGAAAADGESRVAAPAAAAAAAAAAPEPSEVSGIGAGGKASAAAGKKGAGGKDGKGGKASSATKAASGGGVKGSKQAAKPVIDVARLKEYIEDVRKTYGRDGGLQLQLVAAHMESMSPEKRYMHATTLAEAGGSASKWDQPWVMHSAEVRRTLIGFVKSIPAAQVQPFITQQVERLLSGIPDRSGGAGPSGGSGSAPGETPTTTVPWLLLAAACRAEPRALIGAIPALCQMRARLLTPGRVPIALWLLAQAFASEAEEGPAAAMHAWCRVVLPCVMLAEVPASVGKSKKGGGGGGKGAGAVAGGGKIYQMQPAAYSAALAFLTEELLSDEKEAAVRESTRACDVAAVPAAALSGVNGIVAGDKGGVSKEAASALSQVRDHLADIATECGASEALRDLVRAELVAARDGGDAGAAAAAPTLVRAVARHGRVADAAWCKEHKDNLVGSTRVLEHLAANVIALKPIQAAPNGADILNDLLTNLSRAHGHILKNPQAPASARNVASRAQDSLQSMGSASVAAVSSSTYLSALCLLTCSAVATWYMATHPEQSREGLQTVLGQRGAEMVVQGAIEASELASKAGTFLWDLWTGDT